MARSIDRRFYESTEWKICKETYLVQVNHLCERCLKRGLYEPARIVHHKVHLTADNFGDPELMYGFDNLEALCLACHNDEHGRTKKTRRWEFIEGQLVTTAESPLS